MREKRDSCALPSFEALKNPGLFLEPADVFHDLIDVVGRHPLDLRHVAELPMVRSDAVGRGVLEGRIAMMIGFIDLVDKRGALAGPHSAGAMTTRTIGDELLFAIPIFSWRRSCCSLRRCITLAAGRRDTNEEHKQYNSYE